MKRFVRWGLSWVQDNGLWLSGLILVIITGLSLWPLDSLPKVPGTDKTHHFMAYAVLMLPIALRRPRYWGLIGLGLMGYSGLIELLQPYVNRYGEWLDFLANSCGIAAGALIGAIIRSENRP